MPRRVLLQESFKLALSMMLFYWFALYMDWDMPKYGGLAIALISLSTFGGSMQKGALRIIGSTFGLLFGLLLVIWFPQARWLTLLALTFFLIFIGYFMQSSKYNYAWFVTGIIPCIVWAATYMQPENAFYYSVYRYLETTTGIVIYTFISALLWPQRAGTLLITQGKALFDKIQELSTYYQHIIFKHQSPPPITSTQIKLSKEIHQLNESLTAAYADTPLVSANKQSWQTMQIKIKSLYENLLLWQINLTDCHTLELDKKLPQLKKYLNSLSEKIETIKTLWPSLNELNYPNPIKQQLLQSSSLQFDWEIYSQLPPEKRAMLLSFCLQTQEIDQQTTELLRLLCHMLKIKTPYNPQPEKESKREKTPLWNPRHLLKALFPATCFIASYLLWIYIDPPTGPNIPMFTAILALLLLIIPIDPLKLLFAFILALWICIAPVYFVVMPALNSGYELLFLIFVYTFIFSLLGGKSILLKLAPLILFVMMTNISNTQDYSFMKIANSTVMIISSMLVIFFIDLLFIHKHPAQTVVKKIKLFFDASAHFISCLTHSYFKLTYYNSIILPTPGTLYQIEKQITYPLYPDNSPAITHQLFDSIQDITLRLQLLKKSYEKINSQKLLLSNTQQQIIHQALLILKQILQQWTQHHIEEPKKQIIALKHLSQQLLSEIDENNLAQTQALYTLFSSMRGLAESIKKTRSTMQTINWSQWQAQQF